MHETIHFVKALATEYGQPDTPDHLKPLEAAAIEAVKALALAFCTGVKIRPADWERATATATGWLTAASDEDTQAKSQTPSKNA
jgi:hypothetical protein